MKLDFQKLSCYFLKYKTKMAYFSYYSLYILQAILHNDIKTSLVDIRYLLL